MNSVENQKHLACSLLIMANMRNIPENDELIL